MASSAVFYCTAHGTKNAAESHVWLRDSPIDIQAKTLRRQESLGEGSGIIVCPSLDLEEGREKNSQR